uniref:SDR family NAD(P)-dependent oxidoreductase n=1 Tax=Cupriavidus necator TaxID=106590 RepID=UPI003F49358E
MKLSQARVVFITGGSSGIGLAAAIAFAERGADIALFSRDVAAAEQALRLICARCERTAQRIVSFKTDVAEREQVLEGFAAAARDLGEPDLVLHMAGVGGATAFAEMPVSDFEQQVRINLFGTRHVAEAALKHLRARRTGGIVLTGSLAGLVSLYGYSAYGTSKFAVVGFAQCLRAELAPLGIEVACFCPGEVNTPALRAEQLHSPAATRALKALGSVMPVEVAVRGLLHGLSRGKFLIVPGWRSKALYWAARLTPLPLWNAIADAIVARAQH